MEALSVERSVNDQYFDQNEVKIITCMPYLRRIPSENVTLIIDALKQAGKGEKVYVNGVKTIKSGREPQKKIYSSRNAAEQAIISDLVLAGYTEQEILRFFDEYLKHGYCAELPDDEKADYIKRGYQAFNACRQNDKYRERLQMVFELVNKSPFPGRNGGTMKLVILAIITKAHQYNTEKINVSIAEIALFTHLSKSTISKATHQLETMGIHVRFSHLPCIANEYDLSEYVDNVLKTNISTLALIEEHYCSPIVQKYEPWNIKTVWSNSNLGTSAKLVFEFLSPESRTIREITALTGKSRGTVSKALRLLEIHGIARQENRKWVIGETSLLAVATKLNCFKEAYLAQKRYYYNRKLYTDKQDNWKQYVEDQQGRKDTFSNVTSTKTLVG